LTFIRKSAALSGSLAALLPLVLALLPHKQLVHHPSCALGGDAEGAGGCFSFEVEIEGGDGDLGVEARGAPSG